MSSYSISRITPLSGPGTVERNMRTDFGITALLNLASAASASFAKKSGSRPGLTSYLNIAITAITVILEWNPVGWVERSETHRWTMLYEKTGAARRDLRCAKMMGFANAQPILRSWSMGILAIKRKIASGWQAISHEQSSGAVSAKDLARPVARD